MAEGIDLSPAEEAALDRAWARVGPLIAPRTDAPFAVTGPDLSGLGDLLPLSRQEVLDALFDAAIDSFDLALPDAPFDGPADSVLETRTEGSASFGGPGQPRVPAGSPGGGEWTSGGGGGQDSGATAGKPRLTRRQARRAWDERAHGAREVVLPPGRGQFTAEPQRLQAVPFDAAHSLVRDPDDGSVRVVATAKLEALAARQRGREARLREKKEARRASWERKSAGVRKLIDPALSAGVRHALSAGPAAEAHLLSLLTETGPMLAEAAARKLLERLSFVGDVVETRSGGRVGYRLPLPSDAPFYSPGINVPADFVLETRPEGAAPFGAPDQPRLPAGQPGGGEWTSGGGADVGDTTARWEKEDRQRERRQGKETEALEERQQEEWSALSVARDREDAATEKTRDKEDSATQGRRDREEAREEAKNDRAAQRAKDREDAASFAREKATPTYREWARLDREYGPGSKESQGAWQRHEDATGRPAEDARLQKVHEQIDRNAEEYMDEWHAGREKVYAEEDAARKQARAAEDAATAARRDAEDEPVRARHEREQQDLAARHEAEDAEVYDRRRADHPAAHAAHYATGDAPFYSPDQPRDELGRWTTGGGPAGGSPGDRPKAAAAMREQVAVYAGLGISPVEANQGDCSTAAREAIKAIKAAGGQASYGVPENNLGHVWVVAGGRHYDVQAPDGVDDPKDLPFFREEPDLIGGGWRSTTDDRFGRVPALSTTNRAGGVGRTPAQHRERRQAASDAVRDFARGQGPPTHAEAEALAGHLARLTVAQIHAIKAEHGLEGSAPNKAALVAKLAERFAAWRAGRAPKEAVPDWPADYDVFGKRDVFADEPVDAGTLAPAAETPAVAERVKQAAEYEQARQRDEQIRQATIRPGEVVEVRHGRILVGGRRGPVVRRSVRVEAVEDAEGGGQLGRFTYDDNGKLRTGYFNTKEDRWKHPAGPGWVTPGQVDAARALAQSPPSVPPARQNPTDAPAKSGRGGDYARAAAWEPGDRVVIDGYEGTVKSVRKQTRRVTRDKYPDVPPGPDPRSREQVLVEQPVVTVRTITSMAETATFTFYGPEKVVE